MFIVTLLLENLLTWMRRQSGTTSLRALLYFDEVFGYFPPTAEPPSKRPLLTLLKQARAFGLGCVLVTQNPVDIDYKGLTNAGTWFIGKLQAERDKERVLAGLKGALSEAGQASEVDYGKLITRLGNRVFLMHNVHDNGPVVFTTRWAMSYLRGPLTLPQVRELRGDGKAAAPGATAGAAAAAPAQAVAEPQAPTAASAAAAPAPTAADADAAPPGFSATQPVVDPAIAPQFLPIVFDERAAVRYLTNEAGGQISVQAVRLLYEPGVLGAGSVRFGDTKRRVDAKVDVMRLARAEGSAADVDWGRAEPIGVDSRKLTSQPERAEQGPFFAPVPEGAATAKKLAAASKELADWLYDNQTLKISVQPELGIARDPDEDERQFRIRLQQAARERRDAEVDKLTKTYSKQIDALNDKLARTQQALNEAQAKAQAKQTEQWVNIGESVFNFFTGKSTRRAVSSATSKWNQANAAAANVDEAKQTIAKLQTEIQALEAELGEQVKAITTQWESAATNLVSEELKPRRSDVDVNTVTIGWAPIWQIVYADGGSPKTATVEAYQLPEVG
jgi:hypothetical protein